MSKKSIEREESDSHSFLHSSDGYRFSIIEEMEKSLSTQDLWVVVSGRSPDLSDKKIFLWVSESTQESSGEDNTFLINELSIDITGEINLSFAEDSHSPNFQICKTVFEVDRSIKNHFSSLDQMIISRKRTWTDQKDSMGLFRLTYEFSYVSNERLEL